MSRIYKVEWTIRHPRASNPFQLGARVQVRRRSKPTYGIIVATWTQKRSAGVLEYRNPYVDIIREDNGKVIRIPSDSNNLEVIPK